MLILSRKEGDLIRIGDDILVRVLGIKGSVVRLGLEAPAEVPILRGELAAFHPTVHATEDVGVVQRGGVGAV